MKRKIERDVERVFTALNKNGMTRAFIETESGSYIYPPVIKRSSLFSTNPMLVTILIATFLLIGIMVFRPPSQELTTQPGPAKRKPILSSPLEEKDIYGMTPLHHAVIRSDRSTVVNLLNGNHNIDSPDLYGWTPLHWALFRKDEPLCRLLIQNKASIQQTTSKPWFNIPSGTSVEKMAEILNIKWFNSIYTRKKPNGSPSEAQKNASKANKK